MIRNPVMFVTLVGRGAHHHGGVHDARGRGFIVQLAALALVHRAVRQLRRGGWPKVAAGPGRGCAPRGEDTIARRLRGDEEVPAHRTSSEGDLVICEANDAFRPTAK